MIRAVEELAPTVGVAGACRALDVARSSVYRRRTPPVPRERVPRRSPAPALAAEERSRVLETPHEERFVDRAAAAVYATLLEEGRHICSIRTMYRVLGEAGEVKERRAQRRHPHREPPRLVATAPNQVWTWDITRLAGPRKWTTYPLYVVLDLLSRYVVAWMVASRESAALAKRLVREACAKQGVAGAAHAAPGPRGADDGEDLLAAARGPRHPGQLQPAAGVGRQPALREPLQDGEVRAVVPGSLREPGSGARLVRPLLPLVQHRAPAQLSFFLTRSGCRVSSCVETTTPVIHPQREAQQFVGRRGKTMALLRHCPMIVLLVVCLAGCFHGNGGPAPSALAQGGAGKCPKGSHPPTGINAEGDVLLGGQHDTINQAIAKLKQMAADKDDDDLKAIAECLEEMFKRGQICVAEKSGKFGGYTEMDKKAGWGGDFIVLNPVFVRNASNGGAAGVAGAPTPEFKILMGVLAHEGVHAGHAGIVLHSNLGTKLLEKPAVEMEKEVLANCQMQTSSRYKFLCAWLAELCVNADNQPAADIPRDCPTAYAPAPLPPIPPPPPLPGPKTPAYSAVGSTVYVTAEVDIEVVTDVPKPTLLELYLDVPTIGQQTLLVIGLSATEQDSLVQTVVFDDEGVFLSLGAVETLQGMAVEDGARIEGETDLYLLDTESDAIVAYRDTDLDGVPDSLGVTFATATTFPAVASTKSLSAPSDGHVVVSSHDLTGGSVIEQEADITELLDTTSDGVADLADTYLYKDVNTFGPLFSEDPTDGATSVIVRGTVLNTVELWASDEEGNPTTNLGSTAINYADGLGTISLVAALEEGTVLVLKDTDLGVISSPVEVAPEAP